MGTSVYMKHHPQDDFGGKRVLNLGCGFAQFKAANVTNLDAFDICKPDVVWDLNKTPLPFEDETFDFIIANHILEHIPNWWACFDDCARILKPGGIIEVSVPGSGTDNQMGFRDHCSLINQYSFFGINTMRRPASNAWAATEKERGCHASKLSNVNLTIHAAKKWWIRYAPKSVRMWITTHLRNVIVEEIYIFQKESA